MEFEILHNGKDIASNLDILECYACDRYGGMFDDLRITFVSDTNTVEVNENDELEVRTAGGFSSGIMYVDSADGKNGLFTMHALSCRSVNKKRKSKIWHRVKLSKIITDVAKNTGLTPHLYGINDYSYSGVAQIMETDLQMLLRLCKREGYSIKCDNGKLIIFNEYYLEHNSTPIPIDKTSVGNNYSFNRNTNGISSMTVRYYDTETKQSIVYTSADDAISGGEDIRIESLTDINEAQRVSLGYLRDANKYYITGILEMPYNGNISAGTVSELTGFEEFDGRYVVYEARHDFIREKTLIRVRPILRY